MDNATLLSKIPESIMKPHDPNDDPFAGLADDSNQLMSPLEYGSGISYLVPQDQPEKQLEPKEDVATPPVAVNASTAKGGPDDTSGEGQDSAGSMED
jgi:hypothetical protein